MLFVVMPKQKQHAIAQERFSSSIEEKFSESRVYFFLKNLI